MKQFGVFLLMHLMDGIIVILYPTLLHLVQKVQVIMGVKVFSGEMEVFYLQVLDKEVSEIAGF